MSRSRVIPTQGNTDLPTFRVLVDGEQLGARYGVLGIAVSRAVNTIPKARLLLADGSVADGGFSLSDQDTFLPGKTVEIQGGYYNDEDPVFKGIITGHSIKVPERGNSFLRIDLHHETIKMTLGRKNRSFSSMTDSEIIEELLEKYGIAHEVQDTTISHLQMVQYAVSDWDFLVSRAEMNSLLVFPEDDLVRVAKPDTSAEPMLNLAYGSNVISFEASIDARRQYGSYASSAWDFGEQELREEEGESGADILPGNTSTDELAEALGGPAFRQQHPGRRPEAELTAWADARKIRNELAKVRGTVRIKGYSAIMPGFLVSLEQFGARFDGNAFISSVHHQFSADAAWYTDIGFGLDPSLHVEKFSDIEAKGASGMLPAVRGLQPAVVTAIHDDPDGENRIRVRLPLVEPQGEGIWARVAVPDAGYQRGMVFRPEINDEVLIGYINDDPRDAVILGMLHSQIQTTPIEATEENHEKGWVTRSGMRLIFNDDEISFTFETPEGYRLHLNETDETISLESPEGFSLVMKKDEVTLLSPGDLKIEARGDVLIKGSNITLDASTDLTAKGGSGAELSAGGQTVIKGGVVQIN